MTTPKLNYTSKDYVKLREELIARIPVLTNGRWTDLNESDPGIAIVELLTSIADEVLFYLDMQANEAFLSTAVQKRDVINLTKLIDYAPASITSAAGAVLFTSASVPASFTFPVSIPPYTRLSTAVSGGISFVTTTLVGAVNSTPVAVSILNRTTPISMNVVQGTKGEDVFTSDGLPSEKFKLSQLSIDSATVIVKVNGVAWTRVSSFVSADLNSEFFVVNTDAEGKTYVTFGNAQFGKHPTAGSGITIQYIVSLGEAGTVGSGKINVLLDSLVDSLNKNVTGMAVSNVNATTPGKAEESIERTKLLAPAALAALFAAKSKDDYNVLAKLASTAVGKVNTWGEAEETPPNYKMFNKVQIAFSGRNSTGGIHVVDVNPASEYQIAKAAIITYLNGGSRKIITTRNVIVDPTYVHIIVGGNVYIDSTQYDSTTVLAEIKLAINAAFGFDQINFGQDIYPSQVQRVIDLVPGVSWSNITLTANPVNFGTGISRYQLDTTVTPNKITGVTLKKFELPIFEDDNITKLVSGISHIAITAVNALSQPVSGDTLNNPCLV